MWVNFLANVQAEFHRILTNNKFQEGAFALVFKSKYFPGECVATRRGSPLLVGIKTKTRLATDHIPILYGKGMVF
jgi:glucosamine 6-phosphate synthetase-like amidotransferase/phosphosugar isomerase protein